MRILYVFRSLAVWGGIERVLVEKMNHLVSMYGYDVYMLTSDQGNHPIPYHLDERVHLEDLNIRFHQQYKYHLFSRIYIANALRKKYKKLLSNRISQISPDVIVCTTADDLSLLTKLKGKVPLVAESHSICLRTIENGRFWLARKLYRYNYIKALSHVDVIVALTEGDAIEWRKIHSNVIVIPDVVHLNDGAVSSLESKRAIFVGRFDYQKRPLLLVGIWKIIHQMHPDWQLDIYGEGELQKELERTVSSADANIVVHSPSERIFDCYRDSSIIISTSLFEPFGLVIPEAMSCGLPIIAFDCPYGPGDMIEEGYNGFLIRDGDIDSFVEKLSLLVSDFALRKKMGEAAVLTAKRYLPASIMPQWKTLFEKISI